MEGGFEADDQDALVELGSSLAQGSVGVVVGISTLFGWVPIGGVVVVVSPCGC